MPDDVPWLHDSPVEVAVPELSLTVWEPESVWPTLTVWPPESEWPTLSVTPLPSLTETPLVWLTAVVLADETVWAVPWLSLVPTLWPHE